MALRAISDLRAKGACLYMNDDYLIALLEALLANPNFTNQYANFYVILSDLHARARHLDPAIAALTQAQRYAPNPYAEMTIAHWLASAGRGEEALAHIQKARELAQRNPLKAKLLEKPMERWEQRIKKKLPTSQNLPPQHTN